MYARVASAVVFFLFFLLLLVAVQDVCSRGERYSHFFVFPNAPARVTNFREPAGLCDIEGVITLGLKLL